MEARLEQAISRIGKAVAALVALQAVYTAFAGEWDIAHGRAGFLCAAILIVLAFNPLAKSLRAEANVTGPRLRFTLGLIDLAMMICFVIASVHFINVQNLSTNSMYFFGTFDIVLASVAVLVLMDATRRLFGLPIVVVSLFGLVYALFGNYLPGFLHHSGFSLNRLVQAVWYGYHGVFGIPLGVVLQVVLIFVIFGIVLEATGASSSLIRVSTVLTGGTRGGPAHSAVIASGVFGSMSGSVTANVVGTGSFTIPMIKRRGFPAATAGGIEAAASTGGQIVPPVMGAAAFLMANLTGEAYTTICLAALLPALFYYGALFAGISIQAAKLDIQPIPKDERPNLNRAELWACLSFLLPIAVIIALLVAGRSPTAAGFWATALAVTIGAMNRRNRENPRLIWDALVKGGGACASILVAVGCIGIILGVLNLTGVGVAFASMVKGYAESSLLVALIFTAFTALVLGMGMPTLPAYLITVLVLGPTLSTLGAELLAVHLFIFYFGVLSAVTPPVAIGAFAAAPIAQAHPFHTAKSALRLALSGFIIPFVFVYEPSLLLVYGFEPLTLLRVVLSLTLAIWLINTALIGFGRSKLAEWERVLRGILGAAFLVNITELQIALFVVVASYLALSRYFARCGNAST